MLPPFDARGVLPPGDYRMTVSQLRQSALVLGPPGAEHWDRTWREHLVDRLGILAAQLRLVGINEVFVDGSFVTAKDHPHDIDGYFEIEPGELAGVRTRLNQIDPHRSWTWDPRERRPVPGYWGLHLPMWRRYRVELYPHYPLNVAGQVRGVPLEFPLWFRTVAGMDPSDPGSAKGIVVVTGE